VASAVSLLALAAISSAQERPPVAVQMSKTYGLDAFGQVEKIRFTFNLEFPGLNLARTWEFEPKTDQVSYEGKDKDGKAVKLTYNRSRLGGESDVVKNEIEPAFTNDEYWLFFPLHVAWDTSAKVTDEGVQKRPNLLMVTWAGHKKAGPLLISTDHVSTADGKPVRVFLTDVSVKVTGSDGWIDAK
jgi:hypothetical protein